MKKDSKAKYSILEKREGQKEKHSNRFGVFYLY